MPFDAMTNTEGDPTSDWTDEQGHAWFKRKQAEYARINNGGKALDPKSHHDHTIDEWRDLSMSSKENRAGGQTTFKMIDEAFQLHAHRMQSAWQKRPGQRHFRYADPQIRELVINQQQRRVSGLGTEDASCKVFSSTFSPGITACDHKTPRDPQWRRTRIPGEEGACHRAALENLIAKDDYRSALIWRAE